MYGRFLKNQKGSAFLMAVIGIGVLSVITLGAIFMGSTNEKQTHSEGKRTQAYYVADVGAKTIMKELDGLSGKPLKDKLDEMKAKGVMKGTYTDDKDPTSTSKEEWEFEIEVVETSENVYELRSTGIANDIKDGTRAIITIGKNTPPPSGSSGLKMGDGVIYVTTTAGGEFQFHNLNQFGNIDVSIYTMNKNVTQMNDPATGYTKTSSNKDGMVKDMYVKKGKTKEEDHTVEMVYNLNRDMVRNKYLDKGLIGGGLKDEELKAAIENSYFLPITVENHEAFLKDTAIFPEAKYNLPSGEKETKVTLPAKGTIDLTASNYVRVTNKVEVVGGELNIKTSGETNIVFDDEVLIAGGAKLNIEADGRVNFYFQKRAGTTGGDIKVISTGAEMAQVNFYVLGSTPFQAQSGTKVTGCVNLYAPTSDVQLQEKIRWEGIVVAKNLEFNDNVQFRAPSAGEDAGDMNKVENKDKEWTLEGVEWKEWQVKK